MCPTVIIGRTVEGGTVYCRYRWGQLRVSCDHRNPAPHGGAAGQWLMVKQLDPEGLNGCLYYEELRELTADIIEWPDELSPQVFDENDTWLE